MTKDIVCQNGGLVIQLHEREDETMTNLSKTAAIREARPMVGICGKYQIVGPYDCAYTVGPNTTRTSVDYPEARAVRSVWVAKIALNLMGVDLTDIDGYPIEIETGGTIEDIVAYYSTLTPFEARVESGIARGETWEVAVEAAPDS